MKHYTNINIDLFYLIYIRTVSKDIIAVVRIIYDGYNAINWMWPFIYWKMF